MAGSSLLALIDDIATLLDDVTVMTKIAAKKTAGVLGDDLALNAQQVAGIKADRELPVVWAVAVGSLKNKLILIPAALIISALAPWAIIPLLMLGGLYLCFEGAEKLAHRWLHSATEDEAHHTELTQALADPHADLAALERDKIQGAVRTDFILSAEIIVITLGSVAAASFLTQVAVLVSIGLLMTVGVYGLVAGIVKLDDAGLYLSQAKNRLVQRVGVLLLHVAPLLMRLLAVVGTAAMFLVGGGIITHGIPSLHHEIAILTEMLAHASGWATGVHFLVPLLVDALVGVGSGLLVLMGVNGVQRLRNVPKSH